MAHEVQAVTWKLLAHAEREEAFRGKTERPLNRSQERAGREAQSSAGEETKVRQTTLCMKKLERLVGDKPLFLWITR